MAQSKIYWDLENYTQVEKLFRKSIEFSSEHEVWKLNVAHVLFMQVGGCKSTRTLIVYIHPPSRLFFLSKETKFKEAAGFYEKILKKNHDHVIFLRPTCIRSIKKKIQLFKHL